MANPLADGHESLTVAPQPTMAPLASEQVAALCWRLHKGRTQVILVTSRDTGRWVLPKGWPIQGLTPEASAAREAWEEAGVEGKVASATIGRYCYDKMRPGAEPLPCCVNVFPLRVQALKSSFPERKERRRKWFEADDASALVAEEDLCALLLRLHANPSILVPLPRVKRPKADA